MKITLREENGNKLLSFESKSKDEKGIITDLEYVLDKINKERIIDKNQVLFYIDATNGNIFIAGYDKETEEVFDNNGIGVEFSDFWKESDNAYEFDEIVINSIEKALNSDVGKMTKTKYKIFYQTELEDAERIK